MCVCSLVCSISLDVTIHGCSKLILRGKQQTGSKLEPHGDDLILVHVQQHEFSIAADGTASDSPRLETRLILTYAI
jgi:hypothetical protein